MTPRSRGTALDPPPPNPSPIPHCPSHSCSSSWPHSKKSWPHYYDITLLVQAAQHEAALTLSADLAWQRAEVGRQPLLEEAMQLTMEVEAARRFSSRRESEIHDLSERQSDLQRELSAARAEAKAEAQAAAQQARQAWRARRARLEVRAD